VKNKRTENVEYGMLTYLQGKGYMKSYDLFSRKWIQGSTCFPHEVARADFSADIQEQHLFYFSPETFEIQTRISNSYKCNLRVTTSVPGCGVLCFYRSSGYCVVKFCSSRWN